MRRTFRIGPFLITITRVKRGPKKQLGVDRDVVTFDPPITREQLLELLERDETK